MNNKQDSVARAEYRGKTSFEQHLLATNGKYKRHPKASSLVFFADHIAYNEKNNRVLESEKLAYKLHHQDIGKQFIELWWEAKNSKNGEAFRTMARMAERTIPSSPDYQFVTQLKLSLEAGKMSSIPPVSVAVKLFNEIYAVNPGIPKTSYQQMKRVYGVLGITAPKGKRGPKPNSSRKLKTRSS